ncbi:aconitase [Desulfobulbus propionicus DSM 2032]|uniref:Aconitate hydratase n=1 Tax=Desulfobulbus propionicus (strain ATCC 33891 / DSM 2032 / VKM B-1956 / 1pr3) TaxID=577650 RepID=A0A7U3YQ79_DESPD|nr:aconitate hydratase AcnA [Desulfobulbus propionicus]ADW19371.1 aconitase [Desulfobulbus propionicus DSM 2032]
MRASKEFNQFNPRTTLQVDGTTYTIFAVKALESLGYGPIERLPYSLRILLENLLRHYPQGLVSDTDIDNLASWQPDQISPEAVPLMPARVILQDFTGVPALVDLAAMRSALARAGGDPATMNPFIPADLVIDHSVQVDRSATADALQVNVELEMARNRERYTMLHWGQQAFRNFRVVPPGTGIVHQVNLEYLASVVVSSEQNGEPVLYPDSVLGTDSHTTMVNGLGVMGWGVGGIEAEAVLLGQPYSLQIPEVVGVRLSGSLPPGTTATDLVLTITRFLRGQGVVGRFVEFFGPGLAGLSLPDRATIANMAPEYGATMGFFPVDEETLRYLRASGRPEALVHLVEQYCRAQSFFFGPEHPEPGYSVVYDIVLDSVVPSLAGPRRPQDLLPLSGVREDFLRQFDKQLAASTAATVEDPARQLTNGSVVIAAITSCTNTSNPDVMIGAGLLARKARERGLMAKPWVKTSLAPGSRVVTRYLEQSGLLPDLEALGFQVVGYGCTTCIGNSGPLTEAIAAPIGDQNLLVAAVLSGNRNFEARIHPLVRANYLGSPPLVVAYALAGTVLIDFDQEPLGTDSQGQPVYLRDLWPSTEEIRAAVRQSLTPDLFTLSYGSVFSGDAQWQALSAGTSDLYPWDVDSSYIREPPFFQELSADPPPIATIEGARILALFGDSITTDHISPAGSIGPQTPAGRYLQHLGIQPADFNSYGSRRGNHEVMMRGTFANIRIKNRMVEREGGYTKAWPEGVEMPIYDAAMHYQQTGTPLVVLAGRDYGTGSSRDWAAKGTMLLGVKAVIASSFERIHRSNLVGMGVLPLQFPEGVDAQTLCLDGSETISLLGLGGRLNPGQGVNLRIDRADGRTESLEVLLRLDNAMEIDYYRHGGILHKVLRQRLQGR